jgi:DNA-binding winged helix-turn-helix (wHTH) protein
MDMRRNGSRDLHTCLVLGDAQLADALTGRLGDLDVRLVRRPSEIRDALAGGGRHLLVVSIPPGSLNLQAGGAPATATDLRVIFPGEPDAEPRDRDGLSGSDNSSSQRGIGRRLVFDLQARELVRDGVTVHLRPKEFELLALLTSHPRRAFSRQELLAGVWHRDEGRLRTVDVHVHWLRAKIEADPATPRLLRTVPGFGYRYDPPGHGRLDNELLTTGL